MTTTARVEPPVASKPNSSGFGTLLALSGDPDISFWELDVTPPGIDGGEAIPTTTHFNSVWRTFAFRVLKSLTDCQLTAVWAPELYTQILAQVNVNQEATFHFWNAATLDFWGAVRQFTPAGTNEDGEPQCTIVVTPSLRNNSGVIVAPVYTAAGT